MRLFCFGYGFTAQALVERLSPIDLEVAGTRTSLAVRTPGVGLACFRGDAPSPDVRSHLVGATHILISIPPDLEGDAVLRHHSKDIAGLSGLRWIGYLSTIGVY